MRFCACLCINMIYSSVVVRFFFHCTSLFARWFFSFNFYRSLKIKQVCNKYIDTWKIWNAKTHTKRCTSTINLVLCMVIVLVSFLWFFIFVCNRRSSICTVLWVCVCVLSFFFGCYSSHSYMSSFLLPYIIQSRANDGLPVHS